MTTTIAPTTLDDDTQQPDELTLLAREFVQREFPRYVAAARREPQRYPREFMAICAEIGLLGLDTPEAYGGNAVPAVQAASVIEEICRGDGALGLDVLVQNSLTAFPIATFGTEEQKQCYLPRMATGELIACFGLTEPNTGSDAKAIRCKAVRDEARDGWVVNGAKRFITSANGAGVIVLAVRTGRPEERAKGITVLLSEIGDGVESVEVSTYDKFGQPGSQLCEVVFQNHFVPASGLMGAVNAGWEIIEATLQHSRLWIAAQGTGIARRALDETEKYTSEREQFGKKLSDIPEVRNHVAIMRRQVAIACGLVRMAAMRADADDPLAFVWASIAKLVAGETCLWAAHEGMLLHGGMGYTKEMPISQILADAAVIRIYEGAAHIQAKIIGRYVPTEKILALFPPTGAFLVDADSLPAATAVLADAETWRIS